MTYPEEKDPRTGKAPRHQTAATGKKDISNAEIASSQKPNKIMEDNKKLAAELHRIMFDKIGGCAGYSVATEYHIGVGLINEELHCIFGSTMKSIGIQPIIMGDIGHIEEELGLIEKNIVEYQRDINPYRLDNNEKTVVNANRVLNHLDDIDAKLKLIKQQTERDTAAVEMALKSTKIMRKIAMLIIKYPSPQYESNGFKPFGYIEDNVKNLRIYFETEYKPKFPR